MVKTTEILSNLLLQAMHQKQTNPIEWSDGIRRGNQPANLDTYSLVNIFLFFFGVFSVHTLFYILQFDLFRYEVHDGRN